MPIKTKLITLHEDSGVKKENKKTIVEWKTVPMIRVQSIIASVREIVYASESSDLIKIGIVGNPDTGKSTLAACIAHLIHKMSKVPFSVRVFKKDDLLDFEKTIKALSPANYILVFDDVSFLGASTTKKQIEMVKQSLTEIRHMEGREGRTDVKIVTILNYHYTLGLDKYLRQADFNYFTSVGGSETENMETIVGSRFMPVVYKFRTMFANRLATKKFSFMLNPKLGAKGIFTYSYREPFIPVLFWNNIRLRNVVSPTRQWIDPVCSICSYAGSQKFESEIPIAQFIDEAGQKLGESHFKRAVKIRLLTNGINV